MNKKKTRKKQSLLNGALILLLSTIISEVLGVVYKIPLTDIIGTIGRGYTGVAFNLYIPIYNIAIAGLPVAISRLVSKQVAEGKFRDVKMTFKVAFKLFLFTGFVGTVLLLALVYPFAKSIGSPNSIPSMIMVAPAVFVCCIMSTYRGYYSGLRNQTPQALSEVCEVVAKLVVGLTCSKLVLNYGLSQFEQGKAVFGTVCATRADAVNALTPYSAAASIFGVTMGAVASLVFLIIRHKTIGDKITDDEIKNSPAATRQRELAKMLISIAIPIVVSTLVMNITNLIDAWSIQFRLKSAIESGMPTITAMYSEALSQEAAMTADQLKNYIYGAYEIALDFRNLIPAITTSLGLSAIPVLSEAWTLKDKKLVRSSTESVIRISLMISLPAGFGMAVLAKPLLNLLYEPQASFSITAPIMAAYGVTAFIMALSQPVINMLQGIGRADIPMKSVMIGAVVKVVVNFILVGIPSINIRGAVVGTVLFFLIALVYNFISLVKITGVKINWKSVAIKPAFCTILCIVGAWEANGLLNMYLPQFGAGGRWTTSSLACIISVVVAVVIYVYSLIFTHSIARDDVKMLPKGEKICKMLDKFGILS